MFTPEYVYQRFIAIKLHFDSKSNYDFFKYNGQTKAKLVNQRYQASRLAKMYTNEDDLTLAIVSCVLKGKTWIGHIASEEGRQYFKERQAYLESFSMNFENELRECVNLGNIDNHLKLYYPRAKGEIPYIIQFYQKGVVSLETISVLNQLTSFTGLLDKKQFSNIITDKVKNEIESYFPFIEGRINLKRCLKIYTEVFDNENN